MSETKELRWFGPNDCELCGKPAKPPNMVISEGHAMHLGCALDELERLQKRFPKLLAAANVRGTYGPWADDWDDKDARYTMSAEDWKALKAWQEDRAIQADCSNERRRRTKICTCDKPQLRCPAHDAIFTEEEL